MFYARNVEWQFFWESDNTSLYLVVGFQHLFAQPVLRWKYFIQDAQYNRDDFILEYLNLRPVPRKMNCCWFPFWLLLDKWRSIQNLKDYYSGLRSMNSNPPKYEEMKSIESVISLKFEFCSIPKIWNRGSSNLRTLWLLRISSSPWNRLMICTWKVYPGLVEHTSCLQWIHRPRPWRALSPGASV